MLNHTNTNQETQKKCIWRYATLKTCTELLESGEENNWIYYFSMNATEEWLRYIENQTLRQRYNINDNDKDDSQESTKDSNDV